MLEIKFINYIGEETKTYCKTMSMPMTPTEKTYQRVQRITDQLIDKHSLEDYDWGVCYTLSGVEYFDADNIKGLGQFADY